MGWALWVYMLVSTYITEINWTWNWTSRVNTMSRLHNKEWLRIYYPYNHYNHHSKLTITYILMELCAKLNSCHLILLMNWQVISLQRTPACAWTVSEYDIVHIYPLKFSATHLCLLQRSAIRVDTDGSRTITLAACHIQVEVIDFSAQSIRHILLIKWLAGIQSFIDKNHLISCLLFTPWCRIYLWPLLIKIFKLSGYQSSYETLLIPSEMGNNPDLVHCWHEIYRRSNLRDVRSMD